MNLFVSNLSLDTTEDVLFNVFSEFGFVVSTKIVRDAETGMSRGFGFVYMAQKNPAIDAIDNLDCSYLLGNIIVVKEAKQTPTKRNVGGNNRYPKKSTTNNNNRFGGNNQNKPMRTRIPRNTDDFNRL